MKVFARIFAVMMTVTIISGFSQSAQAAQSAKQHTKTVQGSHPLKSKQLSKKQPVKQPKKQQVVSSNGQKGQLSRGVLMGTPSGAKGYYASQVPQYYGYPQHNTQSEYARRYYAAKNQPYQNGRSTSYAMPSSQAYSQYVQQYGRDSLPQPQGYSLNSYPSNRYDSNISMQERMERDRVYSAQVALHALLLRYGTAEGGDRFPNREKLTQEAIRYADLLRYGMTHTYRNPETNIAP